MNRSAWWHTTAARRTEWAQLDWIMYSKYLRIFSNKWSRFWGENQQGPGPRFQDVRCERGTNLHVIGSEAAAVRVSLDHKSRCSPAKNAKHSERVAWICGADTIPSDVMSADESPPEDQQQPPWTWRYSSGLRRRKPCRVFDGGSSQYRPLLPPPPPNQSQSKIHSDRWFLLWKSTKSNPTTEIKIYTQSGLIWGI